MRLTDRTDYAFRVLMYLAVNDEGLATIREIAERYRISNSHLTRVVWELGRAGFVETVRGKGGGGWRRRRRRSRWARWRGTSSARSRSPSASRVGPAAAESHRAASTGRYWPRPRRRSSPCSTATPSATWWTAIANSERSFVRNSRDRRTRQLGPSCAGDPDPGRADGWLDRTPVGRATSGRHRRVGGASIVPSSRPDYPWTCRNAPHAPARRRSGRILPVASGRTTEPSFNRPA